MNKKIVLLLVLFSCCISLAQTDTSHAINVVFLYGSKPKHKHKATETRYFGGLHGGHVTIQVDDVDYGFEPTVKFVHIFPKKKNKRKSDFVDLPLNGQSRHNSKSKTVTFVIPISAEQYSQLNTIHKNYCDTAPFDYAFFGMRCASTTQLILSEIGLVKKKKRFANIVTTFYPKRLRKRLFKLAKKNNYQVIRNEGRSTRRWERD